MSVLMSTRCLQLPFGGSLMILNDDRQPLVLETCRRCRRRRDDVSANSSAAAEYKCCSLTRSHCEHLIDTSKDARHVYTSLVGEPHATASADTNNGDRHVDSQSPVSPTPSSSTTSSHADSCCCHCFEKLIFVNHGREYLRCTVLFDFRQLEAPFA